MDEFFALKAGAKLLAMHSKLNGSACILYKNILKNLAIKMNSNLYLLPSSIHEVIIIPTNTYSEDRNVLKEMVASVNSTMLTGVLEHSYNVILFDMGVYRECDRMMFERCEDRIIIASAKPWEMDATNSVFELASKDALEKYVFCFNFTPQADYAAICEGMGDLTNNVHFLKYTEQPFDNYDFADAEVIFSDCMPEKIEEEKNGLLARFKKRKE